MPTVVSESLRVVRAAVWDRREPHHLAWGLALGLLLGLVPHGNLLAVMLLIFILSVRVNQAMVLATATATSLSASLLDEHSHRVGEFLLTHPEIGSHLAAIWHWPLVAWTDLDNTVVAGSLVIALGAVVPTYLCSYPIFHAVIPSPTVAPAQAERVAVSSPCGLRRSSDPSAADAADDVPLFQPPAPADVLAVDEAFRETGEAVETASKTTVDTRIEVVRISPRPAKVSSPGAASADLDATELQRAADAASETDPPLSEALNYLLRQLRDSREERAA